MKKIADELCTRLGCWNTRCAISEQPAYKEWLSSRFPHWSWAEDFSRFCAETVDMSGLGMNMLCKDDVDFLGWLTPEGVMKTEDSFVKEGLLMIGCSPCGDPLVIDTTSTEDLEIGFVSHEMLWENDSPVRESYRPWPDPLLVFLDRLWKDPDYATF